MDPKNPRNSQYKNTFSANSLNLLDTSNNFNYLVYLPKNFTISTINRSHKFNIDLLSDTSSVISNLISTNLVKLEYYIDINDETDTLEKFSQLYEGKLVVFDRHELPTVVKIIQALNITCVPDYMRRGHTNFVNLTEGVGISLSHLNNFLSNKEFKTFSIITNKEEYKCNRFGVLFSKVIRDYLSENPESTSFVYNINNEYDEILPIINLFNFTTVNVNSNNMHSIRDLIEDLQITIISEKIEKIINKCEKISQTIDEQQTVVDSIEEIFHLLHNIKEYKIENIVDTILESFWVTTEENVQELSAFFLQVIKTDIYLHPKIADLLVELDKAKNESNYLELLTPIIVNDLFDSFGQTMSNCSFIYNLFKRNIVPKEKLFEKIKSKVSKKIKSYGYDMKRSGLPEQFIYSWFFPEIVEMNLFDENILPKDKSYQPIYRIPKSNNSNINQDSNNCHSCEALIRLFYPSQIEDYIEMRNKCEPSDELTLALLHDDVDTFQSIISNSQINININTIPFNIYDDFVPNGKTKFIDYAAAYGSIKCFKYLMLNHAQITPETLGYAAFGGNIEIIKIVSHSNSKKSSPFEHCIRASLIKHRNDIFDWILGQEAADKFLSENDPIKFLTICAINGNAHSAIELVEKGVDISNLYTLLIQIASNNGFYRFAKLIWNIYYQKSDDTKNTQLSTSEKKDDFYSSFIHFNNLSIFKLFLEVFTCQNDYQNCLISAIKNDRLKLIKYFFENHENNIFKFNQFFVFNSIDISLDKKFKELAIYLLNTFLRLNPDIFKDFYRMDELLSKACKSGYIEIVKILTNITIENDKFKKFTDEFLIAASSNSYEICKYFTDLKLPINYHRLSLHNHKLASVSLDIFLLMINNSSPESKDLFFSNLTSHAIINGNIELVEYLLSQNAKLKVHDLINAVKSRKFKIVDLILKFNSSPSFINKNSEDGTALSIAVRNEDIETIKRLLSIPGINPNLYSKNDQTPFMYAVLVANVEIINIFLDFYGDNIQYQMWQIDESLKIILKKLTMENNSYINNQFCNLEIILKRFLSIKTINPNVHINDITLLTYACNKNLFDIVKLILQMENADVNIFVPSNGDTPLICALNNNNLEIAKLLINDKRTDINISNYLNVTPLVIAIEQDFKEIVDLLIKNDGFDPEASRLDYSFFISKGEITYHLMSSESLDVNYTIINNPIFSKDEFETSLTKAVNNGDEEKLDLIIHHSSFDKVRSQLSKAIIISILKNDINSFRKLLSFENKDVNSRLMTTNDIACRDDDTFLSFAMRKNSKDIIKYILEDPNLKLEGNDLIKGFIELCNFPDSPLPIDTINLVIDFDQKHGHSIDFTKLLPSGKSFFTSMIYLKNIEEVVQLFIDHGADPNVPDSEGTYPFEYAIELESSRFVDALMNSQKVDFSQKIVDQKTGTKKTYLHLAARKDNNNIFIKLLQSKLIDINATDDNGETPLMEACRYRQKENIDILFEMNDLDFHHVNNNGEDAIKILHSDKYNLESTIEKKEDYLQMLLFIINKENDLEEEDIDNFLEEEMEENDMFIDFDDDDDFEDEDEDEDNDEDIFID